MDLTTTITDGKLTRRYWDDPILTAVCDPVADDEFGPELAKLGQLMLEDINNPAEGLGGGVGLAAPQIGLAKRIFVAALPRDNDEHDDFVMVNPVLTVGGTQIRVPGTGEGCLSIPDVHEQVMRHSIVNIQWQDALTGESYSSRFEGLDAIIMQHEYDHLDGIMFFDRRRMPKNLSKNVERRWEKIKSKYVKS